MSLADTHAVVEGKAALGGGWTFELVTNRGNVFGGKADVVSQTFRAATEEEAKQWVEAINRYSYPSFP